MTKHTPSPRAHTRCRRRVRVEIELGNTEPATLMLPSADSFTAVGQLFRSWIEIIIMRRPDAGLLRTFLVECGIVISRIRARAGNPARWRYLTVGAGRFHKSPSTDTIPFFKSCECAALKRIKADVVNSGATLRYIESQARLLGALVGRIEIKRGLVRAIILPSDRRESFSQRDTDSRGSPRTYCDLWSSMCRLVPE